MLELAVTSHNSASSSGLLNLPAMSPMLRKLAVCLCRARHPHHVEQIGGELVASGHDADDNSVNFAGVFVLGAVVEHCPLELLSTPMAPFANPRELAAVAESAEEASQRRQGGDRVHDLLRGDLRRIGECPPLWPIDDIVYFCAARWRGCCHC
jgi:hypothetical protein